MPWPRSCPRYVTPRAKTAPASEDPETEAENCIASFEDRVRALEAEAAKSLEEVKWAEGALSGLEDIVRPATRRSTPRRWRERRRRIWRSLERREAETYGFDGVGAWDPVRGALIKVVRGVVLELGREFITDLIGEVAHSMNDECDKAHSLIVDALQGLVDGSDLRTLEPARSELLDEEYEQRTGRPYESCATVGIH